MEAKKIKNVWGYEECPPWLHKKYRERVHFICEECHKHEKVVGKLQPHRLVRRYKGGLYTVCPINHLENNIKSVCSGCHRKYHSNE